MDCESLTVKRPSSSKYKKGKISNRNDLGGMLVNMGGKIDLRELIILWLVFLFIHTELFAENFLKKIPCAVNDDNTMTMKGTMISSLIMMISIVICVIIF